MEANNQKKSKVFFLIGLLSGLLVSMIMCLIVVMCVVRHYSKLSAGDSGYISAKESILDDATIQKIEKIQSLFQKKSIYDISTEDMQRGLIDGVIAGTGDRYAQYYSKEEIAELMGDYGGTFYGVGMTLQLGKEGFPEVQKVYSDSPAAKAGIREGDIIIEVDGEDLAEKSLDDSVSLIRGKKGTPVEFTVFRSGEKDYLTLTAIRDEINVIVVEYEMLEDKIGYIHIEEWYDTTPGQFKIALDDLKSQKMKSLIVDLRSNTGGLLSSVVGVCREVLPEGMIVYTETAKGRESTYECDGKNEIDIPVVILTNGYTASASEIFTAAMKDHNKAITIGTKTYGKGVVQSFEYFSDGSAMKLTSEQYFTPNGTAIDGIGIEPDVEVKFDGDAYYDEENPVDNQLEAAKDYLLGK